MNRLAALVCLVLLAGCSGPYAAGYGPASPPPPRPVDQAPARPAEAGTLSRVTSIDASLAGETVTVHVRALGGVSAFGEPDVTERRVRMPLYHMRADPGVALARSVGVVSGARLVPDGEHVWLEIDLSEAASAQVGFGQRDEDLFVYVSPGESSARAAGARRMLDVVAGETARPTDRAAPVSGERWRFDTVVIDAGHGGRDPGAVANGVREKDVALAVALKVGRYIEDELGVRVVYTRTNDTFVTLRNRGRIANEAGGKLFVSIHANAAANTSAYGTETFFLGLHKNDAAQAVMERENSVVVQYEEDQSVYADLDDEALIMRTLANSAYLQKAELLAAQIESQFRTRVGRKSRGVKQAGFLVLWGASMPAVLVELGFLTNPTEARFLASEEGQDYMASALFRAIREFKERYDQETLGAAR
jgi:N-acetylmuramoyl-L-alanine amidase